MQTGRPADAIKHYEIILEQRPDFFVALNNLAWLRATCPQAAYRNGAQAVTLAQRAAKLTGNKDPNVLSTLAAGLAENGQFPEAIATVEKALRLATESKDQAAMKEYSRQLDLYQQRRPYRDSSQSGPAGVFH